MSPKKVKLLLEKKHRKETGLFLVEGEKNILELLGSDLAITALLGTKDFLNAYKNEVDTYQETHAPFAITEVDEHTLIQSGSLLSNNAGIAVVKQREDTSVEEILKQAQHALVVVLDDVRDPGNLGTIIRTADWYGVTHILCSPTTTDLYNPKVIASSMGSYTRMQVAYAELEAVFKEAQHLKIPITIADLEGASTHTTPLPTTGFLVMGSESHGIQESTRAFATHKAFIPRFGNAESLNVSTATGILLDTIRRNA
jgi:TrmH family RNA methyltransferase